MQVCGLTMTVGLDDGFGEVRDTTPVVGLHLTP